MDGIGLKAAATLTTMARAIKRRIVFKQSELTRADILSTSVDPNWRTGNHGNWLVPVGVPSNIETDLSTYSRRRLKIGKLSGNTREDVY
jgi:hypothetical protein